MVQINPKEVIKRKIISNIRNEEEQLQQVGIDLTIVEDVTIQSQSFVNVLVNEKFDMQDTFGIIQIRSSLSRKGIFLTSGIYDPGFNGIGGVSIYNMSDKPFIIEKGFRIGQIVIFKADAASQYIGHYNKSDSIESKYGEKSNEQN